MPRNTASKAASSAPVHGSTAMTSLMVVVLAAAGFGGGFVLGQAMGAKKHYDRGYAAAWEDAKKKVDAASLVPAAAISTTSLSGTVTAVGPASLEMEVAPLMRNPLDAQTPAKRTVMVTSETAIIIMTARPREQLDKERAEFQAAMEKYQRDVAELEPNSPQPTFPVPPSPTEEKKGTLADIKTGMTVMASAATDITFAETFTATELRVNTESVGLIPPPAPAGDASGEPPSATRPPPGPEVVPAPQP